MPSRPQLTKNHDKFSLAPKKTISKGKASSGQQKGSLAARLGHFDSFPPSDFCRASGRQTMQPNKENRSSLLRKQALAKKLGLRSTNDGDIKNCGHEGEQLFQRQNTTRITGETAEVNRERKPLNQVQQQKDLGIAEAADFVADKDALESILTNKGVSNNDILKQKHFSLAAPQRGKYSFGKYSLFPRQSLTVIDPQTYKQWRESEGRRLTMGGREDVENGCSEIEKRGIGLSGSAVRRHRTQLLTPGVLSATKLRMTGNSVIRSGQSLAEKKKLNYDVEEVFKAQGENSTVKGSSLITRHFWSLEYPAEVIHSNRYSHVHSCM